MFNFISHRSLSPKFRVHISTNSSLIYRLIYHSFSSSPSNFLSNSSNQHSFTVNYLIHSCGLPPESAISASKHLNLKTQEKPDSVLAFFKNHGFTDTQISDVARRCPRVFSYDPQKTLLPKFEFLISKGLSSPDLPRVISAAPRTLRSSLVNRIIPSYNVVRNLLQSDNKIIDVIKKSPYFLTYNLNGHVVENIEILRDAGVPQSNIIDFITTNSTALKMPTERCRRIVKDAKKLGFDPSRKYFISAFHALKSMSVTTWNMKVKLYTKWGWSNDDLVLAFGKSPFFMTASEEKITRVLEFLINKMGLESSVLMRRPVLITFSLEKRIVPRCLFYQDLLDRGLVKKKNEFNFANWLGDTEEDFIDRIKEKYKEKAPQLLKLYQAKLTPENEF